jgi:hypothetical protein
MDSAFALTQLLWAPILASAVSVLYFRKAAHLPLGQRAAVSAHGALLALIYAIAFLISVAGAARANLAVPFWFAFTLPAVSVLFALARFSGNKSVHLLLLAVAACAVWVFFIGTMAVTGDWL